MPKTEKQVIGDWGEAAALRFLTQQGYEIIDTKYRTKSGEIDLIAWHRKKHHGKTLCFIEVKTRSYGHGSAERATGPEKMKRMLRAARSYCLSSHISVNATPIQFEQVSVYIDPDSKTPRFRMYVIPVD